MSEILEPGMKVECIANPPYWPDAKWFVLPVIGQVYSVRECFEWQFDDGWFAAIRLSEIYNPPCRWRNFPGISELAFKAHRFRPIKRRSTSIEIFREIDKEVFTKIPASLKAEMGA